ncbi:unnamed protein product [Rhizophagus irregularis]|uniref:Uncharacterized protein n=1 Tax=Rhizophagus irregularis TaxID=588596 RepID=A0A915ZKT3_9GLOM|nr:unnamed protein product [Rhizophagus irregularis]CAB5215063.1 unnamed protein product [Rhizophagus irregularis]CAB5378220.1 unnamed protein product [Rhizophagus irregularis]
MVGKQLVITYFASKLIVQELLVDNYHIVVTRTYQRIAVVNCQLTDESIVYLAQRCDKLEKLQFLNRRDNGIMIQITDRTLFAFARHTLQLKH